MYNGFQYNQCQYNQNKIHSGRRIRSSYITSNIPRQVIEQIQPEINISDNALIEFTDKLELELNTALTFNTLINTSTEKYDVPDISSDDKKKMDKDFRDIMKEFE